MRIKKTIFLFLFCSAFTIQASFSESLDFLATTTCNTNFQKPKVIETGNGLMVENTLPGTTYLWHKNNIPVAGEIKPIYGQKLENADYSVKSISNDGCNSIEESDKVAVFINSKITTVIDTQTMVTEFCLGRRLRDINPNARQTEDYDLSISKKSPLHCIKPQFEYSSAIIKNKIGIELNTFYGNQIVLDFSSLPIGEYQLIFLNISNEPIADFRILVSE